MGSITDNWQAPIPNPLEVYDETITRIAGEIVPLPYTKNDLQPEFEFFFSDNVNKYVDRIYEMLDHLNGNCVMYDTAIPTESIVCSSNGQFHLDDKKGHCSTTIGANGFYAVFNSKRVDVYKNATKIHQIENTDLGILKNVVDVLFIDRDLLIIDGGIIIRLEIDNQIYKFKTFYGGHGDRLSEYKYRQPEKVIIDSDNKDIYVWDKGNGVVKRYDSNFVFIEIIELPAGVIDIDANKEQLVLLYENHLTIGLDKTIMFYLQNPMFVSIDPNQEGFISVANKNELRRYTFKGLNIGIAKMDNLIDLHHTGETLHTIQNNTWIKNLYFVRTYNIYDGFFDYHNDVDKRRFFQDETCSDYTFNRIIEHMVFNINLINSHINKQFKVNRNGASELISITTIPKEEQYVIAKCGLFVGCDEVVSSHAMGRSFGRVYSMIEESLNNIKEFNNISNDPQQPANYNPEFSIKVQGTTSNISKNKVSGQGFTIGDSHYDILQGVTPVTPPIVKNSIIKEITLKLGSTSKPTTSFSKKTSLVLYIVTDEGDHEIARSINNFDLHEDNGLPSGYPLVFDFSNNSQYITPSDKLRFGLVGTNLVGNQGAVRPPLYKSSSSAIDGKPYNDTTEVTNITGDIFFEAELHIPFDSIDPNTSTTNSSGSGSSGTPAQTSLDLAVDINWQMGAQTCIGKDPKLFDPTSTPISFEELQNPALSCHPLVNTDGSCAFVSARPLSAETGRTPDGDFLGRCEN